MKVTRTSLKGVCLLLLGLAMGAGRSFAADITTLNFTTLAENSSTLAENSSAVTALPPTDSPFKDESAPAAVKTDQSAPLAGKAVLVEPPVTVDLPLGNCCGECCDSCSEGCACGCDDFAGAPGRFWFRGEYLHWWTSGAHLPPLVSTLTGPNADTPATIYGDRDTATGDHDGYRLNFGMWLDCEHCWGLEADYFDIAGRQDNFDSGFVDGYANGATFPVVRIVNEPGATANPQADFIAFPQNVVGHIRVDTSDYFQSAGIWLRHQLWACEWSASDCNVNWTDPCARTFRLDGIAGYRFARLIDSVNEQDDSFIFNLQQPLFGNEFRYINDYHAVNTFNGCDLGLNAVYTRGRWSLDVLTKIAIGATHENVSMFNQEILDVSNARGIGTPPIAVNPNPLQEFSRNHFAVIPELMLTAGYQFTDHVKATVGYDLLYWTSVARAADQIAVGPGGYPIGTLVGNYAGLPAYSFNESHLLAQGLRLGAEIRF